MALVLNEEQRLLQDTAREFLDSQAPVEALRKLRDDSDPLGYAPDLWQQMAEMGWASIILPEAYGGLEFGFLGLGVVLEETGRTLTASPLLASAVVGASAILLGGSEAAERSPAARHRVRRADPGPGTGRNSPSPATPDCHALNNAGG